MGGGGGTGEPCWDPNAPAFVRASKEDISPPPLATQAVSVSGPRAFLAMEAILPGKPSSCAITEATLPASLGPSLLSS